MPSPEAFCSQPVRVRVCVHDHTLKKSVDDDDDDDDDDCRLV